MSKAYQYGFTHVHVKKTNFLWTINNFSYSSKATGEHLLSPEFSTGANDGIKWLLQLSPNGINKSYENYISIYLVNKSANFTANIEVAISIINIAGKECNRKKEKCRIAANGSVPFPSYIDKKFYTAEMREVLLPNDVLTISCDLVIIDCKNYPVESLNPRMPVKSTFLDAFERQFKAEAFCDVTLTAPCGKQLHAHKFVLSARSPVFSSMFQSDMKEKHDNAVIIKDIDYDALQEMLRFMYSAKVENLGELAGAVLAAAEKYQVDGLKDACETYLFKNMGIYNAVEIYSLCCKYNMDELKGFVSTFIRFHAKGVSDSIAFKDMEKDDLVNEIISLMVATDI